VPALISDFARGSRQIRVEKRGLAQPPRLEVAAASPHRRCNPEIRNQD
jgi:hypothetical protein